MSASNSVRKDYTTTNYEVDNDKRVIPLFDMDCFEYHVHAEPWQRGKPGIVINSHGRVVSVSYEARKMGINRDSTPYREQAEAIYDNLEIIEIPTRGPNPYGPPRPDTSIAREATARVVTAIKTCLMRNLYLFGETVFEYSSGDEFYVEFKVLEFQDDGEIYDRLGELFNGEDSIDWSTIYLYNGTVVDRPTSDYSFYRVRRLLQKGLHRWSDDEIQESKLLIGAAFSKIIVDQVKADTGFPSSVGVTSKKLMSKICSGLHKPGSITVLAPSGFFSFAEYIKIENIPGLAGDTIGQAIKEHFDIKLMSQLQDIGENELINMEIRYGRRLGPERAREILNKAYGICDVLVQPTDFPRSCGVSRNCSGNFYSWRESKDMIRRLCPEMSDKLEFEERVNHRTPLKITFKIKLQGATSRSARIDCPGRHVWEDPRAMFSGFCNAIGYYNDGQVLSVKEISINCDNFSDSAQAVNALYGYADLFNFNYDSD